MPPIFAEQPWYLADDLLCLEDGRELVEPFVAKEDDHEFQVLRAYDAVRREIVQSPRPLANQLARRKLLEQVVGLALQYRGVPILAGGLFAYWDGAGVEVVRAPQGPKSNMARHGSTNRGGRKPVAV